MKIVICGAGIAGLALAQRMHSHGWEVCVVEHAPGPRDQGYMLDFIGPGYDAAEAMGVLPRLQRLAYPHWKRWRILTATVGAGRAWITPSSRGYSREDCSALCGRTSRGRCATKSSTMSTFALVAA